MAYSQEDRCSLPKSRKLFLRPLRMKSWSEFLSKGEALAKQVTSQAVALAEKAKQEEWVKQVKSVVTEVCIQSCLCIVRTPRLRKLSKLSTIRH